MKRRYIFSHAEKENSFDKNFNQSEFLLHYKSALLLSLTEKNLLTKEQFDQCLSLLKQKQTK